ncbi:MAG: DUF2085 domain-containing protein [Anaerolineae bacterium]|nr:DUF2085 domain-containing protein [Anaerolineae bacterium]
MGSLDLDKESQQQPTSSEDIIAEAQRRIQMQPQREIPLGKRIWVRNLTFAALWFSQHWVAVFNTIVGLFVGGALLAPILMYFGATGAGQLLHDFYSPHCHQYPFRSWFLFGPQASYRLTEPLSIVEMNKLSSFVGNADVGYKTALCQRDIAIYSTMVFTGIAYGLLRRKYTIPPLSIWAYIVFGILPMLIDGGSQWISYVIWTIAPELISRPFETYPLLRTLTGALFGFGCTALAYPYMNEYFEDMHQTLKQKLAQYDYSGDNNYDTTF